MVNEVAIQSVLVANRGEIALRVIKSIQRMGLRAVAVYSQADADLPFVKAADTAVMIGPAPAAQSYMNISAVLLAARETNCDAVHPGYGFLSESPSFARAVFDAGLVWIGPTPETIGAMGDKINARNLMSEAGVPVAAGSSEPLFDVDDAIIEGDRVGYPLMVKASAGGGGIGMTLANDRGDLELAFHSAQDRASRFFGNPAILLERYIPGARHVEVQVLGLADGTVVALGERDCSVQRRHQKVAEETPSPGVGEDLRMRLKAGAIRAAEAIKYVNAGTVECLVDPADQSYVFLEMNTRLQVEHPITEMVTGIDLVAAQVQIADGSNVGEWAYPVPRGHAIEFRIYAEDSERFLPSPGTITDWKEPCGEGIRVDSGYVTGNEVTPFYDPLLAKLCTYGRDRIEALHRARQALDFFQIEGIATNLPFLRELVENDSYLCGNYDTGLVKRMRP